MPLTSWTLTTTQHTKINRMKFVSAQPASTYFAWQLAVQLTNFRSVGIDLADCHVLLAKQGELPDEIIHLIGLYPEVSFYIVEDHRTRRYYSPSVRFFLLNYLQRENPALFQGSVFYHDSDILFINLPDFKTLCSDDTWYASDTRSYLNANYIKSKGEGLLENMASIVGVDPLKVLCNNQQAGGAQYLIKNVPTGFFEKMEIKSEKLYFFLKESQKAYRMLHYLTTGRKDYHPIQEWCADMWVLFWSALANNIRFEISDELSFCFATDRKEKLDSVKIYHDAGVTDKTPQLFKKSDYRNLVPDHSISTDSECCSQFYVDAIKQAPCL
jgi:hypothetical protein